MRLLNLFKKAPTIQDDFFGTLTFMSFKDSSMNYFEGKGKFRPTNSEVEYFIDANESGPVKEQREFYKKIEDSYEELISKVKPLIELEFKNLKDDFEIRDFKKEFKLVSLTIPRPHFDTLTWDISFESPHDDNHIITIDFKNFEARGIVIDG